MSYGTGWGSFGVEALLNKLRAQEAEIARLTARVGELEAEQRWRPVSEPPETDECALIAMSYPIMGRPCTTGQYVDGKWYCDDFGGAVPEGDITYWMPMPAPPEVAP